TCRGSAKKSPASSRRKKARFSQVPAIKRMATSIVIGGVKIAPFRWKGPQRWDGPKYITAALTHPEPRLDYNEVSDFLINRVNDFFHESLRQTPRATVKKVVFFSCPCTDAQQPQCMQLSTICKQTVGNLAIIDDNIDQSNKGRAK
ncbi:MAG TPA: hypothetical protein VFF68_08505, partial [Anaerolineaceae bacterium]|nr:hypothetical protein [Anaerolineaceae bacterium]